MTAVAEVSYLWVETADMLRPAGVIEDIAELLYAS
jgi:hypothetical protein